MNKERLEEIKNGTYLYFRKHNELKEDMDWLIEQAERVQELEVWYHSYHKEAKLNNILKIQNKRYREALKNIYELAEYDEYDNTLEQIVSEVEKALEGEC